MRTMMQFREDAQVAGRFFPRGAQVQVIEAGDSALVLPDSEAFTMLCSVPARKLARLKLFRVVLANRAVGLTDRQERWGLCADDILSNIARLAPDCEVIALEEVVNPG